MNIIADVAGQFDALMRLVKLMPDEEFLFVGDLVDRGPKSKEVVDWVIKNAKSLKGNHEDMMVDFVLGEGRYQTGVWLWNGGDQTRQSYLFDEEEMTEAAEWMKTLPLVHNEGGLFVSHAAWAPDVTMDEALDPLNLEDGIMWNRGNPEEIEGKFQVLGHNSRWGLKWFGEVDNPWGVCIDGSRSKVLTGINWPTKEIFQVPYEESK